MEKDEISKRAIQLLLNEANDAESRYKSMGIGAFKTNHDSRRSKGTNKRFLNSLIRDVDDHNHAILRGERPQYKELREYEGRGSQSRSRSGNDKKESENQRERKSKRRRYSRSTSPLKNLTKGSNPRSNSRDDFPKVSSHRFEKTSMDMYFDPSYDPRNDFGYQKRSSGLHFAGRNTRKTSSQSSDIKEPSTPHFAMTLQYSKGEREWDKGKNVQADGKWAPPSQTFVPAQCEYNSSQLGDVTKGNW